MPVVAPTVLPTAVPTALPLPLVVALPSEPHVLHPFFVRDQSEQAVSAALFVGCVGEDSHALQVPGGTERVFFKVNPIALGCEHVPGTGDQSVRREGAGENSHWVVDFRIRQGWRWTDGRAVTSADVLYAWRVIMNPESQIRDPLTQKVFLFEAADANTVRVHFMSAAQARQAAKGTLRGVVPFEYFAQQGDYDQYAQQTEPLFDEYYWAVVRWLPEHAVGGITPGQQRAANTIYALPGDGAFELAAWNPGSDITLHRSPLAFPAPEGLPNGTAQTILFKFAASPAAADDDVAQGRANVALARPVDPGHAGYPLSMERTFEGPALLALILNTRQEPFDNVLVRKAAYNVLTRSLSEIDPALELVGPREAANPSAGDLLALAGWQCHGKPCTRVITQTVRGTRTEPITKTLEFSLTLPDTETSLSAGIQTIQRSLGELGFATHLESRVVNTTTVGDPVATRRFGAFVVRLPLPMSLVGVFGCENIGSAKRADDARQNLSGLCLDPKTDKLALSLGGDELGGADPTTAATWQSTYNAMLANFAPMVPLGRPKWKMLVRGVDGVDYAGFGPESWNAWMWSRT